MDGTAPLVIPMSWSSSPAAFVAVVNGYMLAVAAPAAVAHSSQLLGFVAAAALFGAVGFFVVRRSPCQPG